MSLYDTYTKSRGSQNTPPTPENPAPTPTPASPSATGGLYSKFKQDAPANGGGLYNKFKGIEAPQAEIPVPSDAPKPVTQEFAPAPDTAPKNGLEKVSEKVSDFLINKPIKYLGDKLYNAFPNYFDAVVSGVDAQNAEGKKNLGVQVLQTLQQGEKAISGLTGGIITPKTVVPDTFVGKLYGDFSQAIGTVESLGTISKGLAGLTDTTKVVDFLAQHPKVYQYALPYIQNAVGFGIYGQLDPHLGANLVDRLKKLSVDVATSVPYTALGGVKNPKVSIPASFALGFGMAKLSGASNEDAFISGTVLGGLDAYGRFNGAGNHFIDGRAVEKKLQIEAINVLNQYSDTKLTPNSSPEEIKKAYRAGAHATHPDTGGSQQDFIKISSAYQFLTGQKVGDNPAFAQPDNKQTKPAPDQKQLNAYNAKGASGEFGAYQIMPDTWKGWAKTYLGDPSAPMTAENQDTVARAEVGNLLTKYGGDVRKVALTWNGGSPVEKKGVNGKGVAYDSGAYADKVVTALAGKPATPENVAAAIKTVETGGVTGHTIVPTPATAKPADNPTIDISKPAVELQQNIENQTQPAPKVEAPQADLSGAQKAIADASAEIEKTKQELEHRQAQLQTDKRNVDIKNDIEKLNTKLDDLNLAQEARKYSSAEDFVKSFGLGKGGVGTSVEYTPMKRRVIEPSQVSLADILGKDAKVTVYRGIDQADQKTIIGGDYVGTSRDIADSYTGTSKVLTKRVNLKDIYIDKTDGITSQEVQNWLDGKETHLEGNYVPNPLIESQLVDVWNKTVGTQSERVKTTVKEGAKSIKQIAQETGIKEPNIRRILGEGAKEGTFERVEKGVYILNNGAEDVAYIHTGDAVETLPKLAQDGLKVDMVFLDIPYNTPSVKGGNRGVKYDLVSVDDFRKVMKAVSEIVRTDETPVYYMFSQAKSGLSQMLKYNDVLTETGFKPVAKGEWQKMFDNGKPVTNVRGEVARPEGILLLNKKGEFIEKDAERNLDFTTKRPKGYQTEKPAELLRSLILQGTTKGSTVLDPFAGSGVTGAEAVKTGRKAVLVEKNKQVAEKVTKPRVASAIEPTGRNWRIGYDETTDPFRKGDILKAIANGKSTEQELSDVMSRLETLSKEVGGGFSDIAYDVSVNPAVSKETKEKALALREKTTAPSKQPFTGSSGNASIGRFRDDTPIDISNPDNLKTIQFPELVALSKELSGNDAFVKKYAKANGMFYGKNGGEIGLNPELFKRENLGQLTKTMAHEIGHLIDYLPDETLNRGNLMGRLNTLSNFRKEFFAPAGASRSDAELRDQMWELSKYWRPIDESTATKSYLDYRKSSKEIYADFISALFNDPRKVSEVAPTAYNVFFRQLDAKPEVKLAYFELQKLLRDGNLTETRRDNVKQMFKVTEQEAKERQIQDDIEREMKEKSIWFKFKTQAVDVTEAVKEKVKEAEKAGKYINPDDNPTYYLEERNYIGGRIKAEVDEKFNTIYQELQKHDMTWEDLGELMFYERILKGDRQDVANPLGFQPDFVQELYDVYEDNGTVKPDQAQYEKGTSDMKTTLGAEKFATLQALATEYRANLKALFVQGREEGLYNAEIEKLFNENAFYVPFKGAKYSGTNSSFAVKHQKGTLGNIENPANTGIEKGVSIIKAIERNKVTRKTVEFLQSNFGDEVQEASLDKNGYPLEPRDKDLGLVTYMQDGKVKGFYVDKYITDAIKKTTIAEQNLLIGGLRFMNSGLFRPLFITFNLGFQSFNAIRDFKRFWKNVPDMTVLKALKLYKDSARASKIRAFGLPENPTPADLEAYKLVDQLEHDKVLSITFNDIIKGESLEDAQIERIMRNVGLREKPEGDLGKIAHKLGVTRKTPVVKQLIGIMDWIEKSGNFVESLPKIAGVKALDGKMPAIEMRSYVRKYLGSPDFLAGGKFKPYMNEVFLFSNAIFQGIRADYEIATQPKTRSSYWWKTAQADILPKLLMLLATAGLFGEGIKKMMEGISEYDKSNYTVVPLGLDQNGKTIYFRIPSDESGRLLGGLFWKVTNAVKDPKKLAELDTYTNLLSYAGGQVPSISPAITSTFNLTTFLAGNNPYDFFRDRPVLSDEQMQAGGMEKIKPFAGYLFEQMGGNVFAKLYSNETVPKNQSLSEKFVGLPVISNVAGRFLKVSDYGRKEQLQEISKEVQSQKAQTSLANRRVVFDYVDQAKDKSYTEAQAIKREMIQKVFGGFPKTADERTTARSLEKRFDLLRLRGSADANVDALLTAQSNDEKVALLQEYKKTMGDTEFADLQKFIIKNRVVSSDVFRKFRSSGNPQ